MLKVPKRNLLTVQLVDLNTLRVLAGCPGMTTRVKGLLTVSPEVLAELLAAATEELKGTAKKTWHESDGSVFAQIEVA